MRDIILSLILIGLMPSCFKRPFVGLCVFSWLAYMRVQDLTWGFAKGQRWSFYVAILMYLGWFFSKDRKPFFARDPRCYLMMLLVFLTGVSILVEGHPDARQFSRYVEFGKIILVALFTTGIVTDRERLRVILWVIAFSMGFYGIKNGIGGIVSGGAAVLRGPGGMLADNNDLAMALSMGVPMLFMLGWTERRPEIRKAFWFCVPLTVMAVGLTQSRGGFLSVSAAIGVLVWRSRNRLMGIGIACLIAVAALVLMPDSYKKRLETLRAPTEEGSAASRLRAWGVATKMALDNPVFGVGFERFRHRFKDYADHPTPAELAEKGIVAHSSYFQVWAEVGTPSVLIYFSLIFGSLWTCWRVRKEARSRYFASWIGNYATMFEASIAAFVVGAAFLNRAHFDLFYHWVALVLVFGRLATQEMRNESLYPVRDLGTRGPVQFVRGHGFDARPRLRGFRRAGLPQEA